MLNLGGYFLFIYIYFVRVSFGLRIESSGGGWSTVSYVVSLRAIVIVYPCGLLVNTLWIPTWSELQSGFHGH